MQPVLALEFKIDSPNKNEVGIRCSMTRNLLRWFPKDNVLMAELTFSDANYAGDGTPIQTDTYQFSLPGVTFDPATNIFYVAAPTGEKVAFAQRTKIFLGSRIDLYKIARIFVCRIRGEVTVSLEVNTSLKEEAPPQVNPDGTVSVPLNQLLK